MSSGLASSSPSPNNRAAPHSFRSPVGQPQLTANLGKQKPQHSACQPLHDVSFSCWDIFTVRHLTKPRGSECHKSFLLLQPISSPNKSCSGDTDLTPHPPMATNSECAARGRVREGNRKIIILWLKGYFLRTYLRTQTLIWNLGEFQGKESKN